MPPTTPSERDPDEKRSIRRMLGKLRTDERTPAIPAPAAPPGQARASGPGLSLRRRAIRAGVPLACAGNRASAAQEGVALDRALQGMEITAPDGEAAYVITTTLSERSAHWRRVCESFWVSALGPGSTLLDSLRRDRGPKARPEDILFLDIETTGLGNYPLFLAGAMTWEEDGLVARQLFARHDDEERAVLSLLLEHARSRGLLISFNGKAFDWPFVCQRAAYHRLRLTWSPAHLDLLHECRRRWQGCVPDCKLQTLERVICGRERHSDIPGHLIPQAYHDFVRTGDPRQMAQVVEHNLLDLATMAELMVRLGEEAD